MHSAARMINREIVVLLGWGRAILLQLAHPLIATAIAEHSDFDRDLAGYVRRAHRTVGAMLSITFGSEQEARAVVARINAIHERVHGTLAEDAGIFPAATPYSARDPRLLRWVHATLLDSLPNAYETFVGPLSREDKDAFCAEAAPVGQLLGIPEEWLPTTNHQLQSYIQDVYARGELHVIPRARRAARALLAPPLGPASPLFRLADIVTVGLLPPAIRDAYGFRWNARRERLFRNTATLLRRVRPLIPTVTREWPSARRATTANAA